MTENPDLQWLHRKPIAEFSGVPKINEHAQAPDHLEIKEYLKAIVAAGLGCMMRAMPDSLPDRPKSSSLKPLRALWPYIAPYRLTLAMALGALLLASIAMLSLPVALRNVIDSGLAADNAALIDQYFIGMLLVAAVFGAFAALRFYLVTWLGERVVADIRTQTFARVIRLDPAYFETTQTGEVLSRLTTDTTLIQSIAGVGISIALRSIVNLIGALIMLAISSQRLMGIILILIPIVIVPIIAIGRRVRTLSRSSQDRIADSAGMAGETLNAVQTVQAFTLETLQTNRFSLAVEAAFSAAVSRIRIRALLTAVAILLSFGAITLVLWLGAQSVIEGTMTGGMLSQFLLYALFIAGSAASLSEMWGEVQRAAGAMERLVELNEAEPAVACPENPLPLPQPSLGSIEFSDVGFNYPSRPDTPAIADFTLDIKPGETVAFVGPSGAGKSTTFQLLLRFFDPQTGSIRVDGIDISQADPAEVRRRIGLVPQDTVVFGATARENIRYGRPEATDEEIQAAAEAAAAHEFIARLPDGYESFLGERGTRLSGGQKQRIAIARAILKNPPILLLDEATSSLDAESEQLVQHALERLMEERTTIIIAHRLATVLKADRIVVIDQGRIVAVGSHDELLLSNPLYGRLAKLQFAAA